MIPLKLEIWDAKHKVMHRWDDKKVSTNEYEDCINSIHVGGIVQFVDNGMVSMKDKDIHIRYFTGKLDADGDEIYSRDIVMNHHLRGVVEWSDYYVGFVIRIITSLEGRLDTLSESFQICERLYTTFNSFWRCVVVGNIYQNPEMLEENNGQAVN